MNIRRNRLRGFLNACLKPIDGAWLAALRILFGIAMCVSMVRFLAYGWVERFFVAPSMHFKYFGFSWVEPLSGPQMHLFFQGMVVLAACMAVGIFYRIAAALFTIGLFYMQLLDVSTYLNHYYLAALLSLLLSASPAGKIWSVDAALLQKRGRGRPSTSVDAFWLYFFRFQVGVVYIFAGLAKLNRDWLVHAQPLRIWLGAKTDLPVLGPLFTIDGVPLMMSWAGFLFDTTIVIWLSIRRTRPFAYVAVLVFHTLTRLLFPIGMFPVIMSLAALVFFSPGWPRRAASLLLGWLGVRSFTLGASLPRPAQPVAPTGKRVLFACALTYCFVQVLVPARGLLYGSDVKWHEQGMRFSWRVMLRAKGGSAVFQVRDGVTGHVATVHPRDYLTDLQELEMVSQPDLILQMARTIERDYQARGFEDVEVRVDARVSLNGRRSAALVLPNVDLTKKRDGLGKLDWVTPAPRVPPPHTRPVL